MNQLPFLQAFIKFVNLFNRKMKLVDTHAHIYLHHFQNDLDEIIIKAKQNHVHKIILPNIDSSTIEPLLKLSEKFPEFFFPTIGLHPGSVKESCISELKVIENAARSRKFVAIGEIGIDCYWDTTFLKEQIHAFEFQINLALQSDLPVIIHCRDSFDLIIQSLEKFKGKIRGVFHAFTGNISQVEKVRSLGFKFGIGGVVTFKNSGLSNVVEQIPLEDILLETDSPYLTPAPHRGKRNESSYLIHIAEKIAQVKNKNLEEVSEITSGNASLLFGLD
jgi:TatD DNase family protein